MPETLLVATPTIRPAAAGDLDALAAMQVDAGGLFRGLGMALVADGPAPSAAELDAARAAGHLLVAVADGRVVGFVRTRPLDGALHVVQVTVAPAAQRRGIGRALMLAAERAAAEHGFTRLTLTTFRDVPFNGPFYRRLGWRELAPDTLTAGLAAERREEAEAGLDSWPRVAMEKRLAAEL